MDGLRLILDFFHRREMMINSNRTPMVLRKLDPSCVVPTFGQFVLNFAKHPHVWTSLSNLLRTSSVSASQQVELKAYVLHLLDRLIINIQELTIVIPYLCDQEHPVRPEGEHQVNLLQWKPSSSVLSSLIMVFPGHEDVVLEILKNLLARRPGNSNAVRKQIYKF